MAAARSHRENTLVLSKARKKPATKARPKENAALSGRDQGKEWGGQSDATALAEATTLANRRLVAELVQRLVEPETAQKDEATVDRAVNLLDLIDRKLERRDRERQEKIKQLEEEANIPSQLDFRQGIIFITGTKRADRAETNFIEYLLCKGVLTCPPDAMKEELLRLPDVATLDWLALKRRVGFSKDELLGHRSWFKLWARLRPAVRKVRGPP